MFSSQLHKHLDDKKQWLFVKWLYLQLAAQKLNQKRGWTYRCCICLARWILLPLWWSHKDRADRRLGWSGPCRSRADTVHRYPSQTAPDPLGIQLKTKQCTYKFSCLLQLLPTLFKHNEIKKVPTLTLLQWGGSFLKGHLTIGARAAHPAPRQFLVITQGAILTDIGHILCILSGWTDGCEKEIKIIMKESSSVGDHSD